MLTIEDIKANARLAYAEKRLTAQNPTLAEGQRVANLRSPDGKFCCALGASLPEELEWAYTSGHLPEHLVGYSTAIEASDIAILHDRWHRDALDGLPAEKIQAAEAKFLEAIQ